MGAGRGQGRGSQAGGRRCQGLPRPGSGRCPEAAPSRIPPRGRPRCQPPVFLPRPAGKGAKVISQLPYLPLNLETGPLYVAQAGDPPASASPGLQACASTLGPGSVTEGEGQRKTSGDPDTCQQGPLLMASVISGRCEPGQGSAALWCPSTKGPSPVLSPPARPPSQLPQPPSLPAWHGAGA